MKRIIVKVNNKIFNFKRNLANINKKSNNCNIKYQKLINFLIFEIIRKIVFHVKLAHLHSPDTKSRFLNKIFCTYNKNLRFGVIYLTRNVTIYLIICLLIRASLQSH